MQEHAMSVELDELFDRAHIAIGTDGWIPMDAKTSVTDSNSQNMDVCMSRFPVSDDVSFVRAQCETDIPIEVCLMLAQPEVFFSSQRPPTYYQIKCGIEKLISPGDAITWVETKMTPVLRKIVSLMGKMTGSALFTTRYRCRHCVRRDFPRLGCVTVAFAPLDPESDVLLEEWGVVKSTVAVLEKFDDDRVKCTELQHLRRVPNWALPMAAPTHFKHQLQSISDFTTSNVYDEVTADGNYIIVGIRRCVKGPPLVPRENCAIDEMEVSTEWVEAERGGVRLGLPEYLTMFLSRIGINDVGIYDKLHGRQVVRYQAVVQKRGWERAWALLETPFRIQRAAYRRLHGGSNAPDITIDMAPKFLPLGEVLDSGPMAICASDDTRSVSSMCIEDTPTSINVPTARTFIHYSENTIRSQLSRVDSEPVLVLSY